MPGLGPWTGAGQRMSLVLLGSVCGLLGCGGVDCVEVTKKGTEVAEKVNKCVGGDTTKVSSSTAGSL